MAVDIKNQPCLADMSCAILRGVGPSSLKKLAALHIHSVQDLLFHLPLRYQDRTRVYPISHIKPGVHSLIEGEIVDVKKPFGGKTRLFLQLADQSGFIGLRFFYMTQVQARGLVLGSKIRCFGEVRFGPSGLEMVHPEYTILTPGKDVPLESNLTPVYPATEGLHQLTFRRIIDQALVLMQNDGLLDELLPAPLCENMGLSSLKESLIYVHKPPVGASQKQLLSGEHPCQQRLALEELVAQRLSLLRLRRDLQRHRAEALPLSKSLSQQFLEGLPFQLTGAQVRVVSEIEKDLQKVQPMLRLVQGDVGSGKTVVAIMAVLQAIEAGCQAAVMAPTEILAQQHYERFSQWLSPLGVKTFFLVSKLTAKQKREVLTEIAETPQAIVVGTHALFQKDVEFNRLALLVIDEQHRFGVHQRLQLHEKGMKKGLHPHQLIMTATPIPRTLAMTAYADLDVSVIDELPSGRKPVKTLVLSDQRRDEVIARVRETCRERRQVYWVCTLIEESEVLQCQAAEDTEKQLQEALPALKVALIHGRIKSSEKEAIMQAFKRGEIDLLVATTVIEVGVDVPNASVMVIENPERLGLAQLHQLRGRVGRGSLQSFCVLMYRSPLSQLAKERLHIMRDTQDGFIVAQKDLALRGPGEVLGTKQTGIADLRIADIVRDQALLPKVHKVADHIMQHAPDLIDPLIQRWLPGKEIYRQV